MLAETLAASAAVALNNAWLAETQRQYVAELEARNEELGTFAHTLAYGLKSPLAKTVGFSAVLEKDHVTMPEEEVERHLCTIAQNGCKMSNIKGVKNGLWRNVSRACTGCAAFHTESHCSFGHVCSYAASLRVGSSMGTTSLKSQNP
jgi:hypothetical protein